MDGSEHDLRPCKRTRLDDNSGPGIISPSSFQFDGDQGVYNQSPPRLNLKEAQNINSLISTSETRRHLTIDDQFTHCTAFDRQKIVEDSDNIDSSSAAAGTLSDCNNGSPISETPNQVCFGMVGLLPLEELHTSELAGDD